MNSPSNSLADSLLNALRGHPEIGPKMKEIDAIEAEVASVVEAVDLEVAFSPVLMRPGDSLSDAVEVAYKGENGKYVFTDPFRQVSADDLKVMRARYLIVRGKAMAPALDRFFAGGGQ